MLRERLPSEKLQVVPESRLPPPSTMAVVEEQLPPEVLLAIIVLVRIAVAEA